MYLVQKKVDQTKKKIGKYQAEISRKPQKYQKYQKDLKNQHKIKILVNKNEKYGKKTKKTLILSVRKRLEHIRIGQLFLLKNFVGLNLKNIKFGLKNIKIILTV